MGTSDLSDEQNERLRKAMETVIREQYAGVRSRLAAAMGMSAPPLSDFLNRRGGASWGTAEVFAEKILKKKDVYEVIGRRRNPSPISGAKPIGFAVDPETERKARVLLRQPPQSFSDEAISIAKECVVIDTAAQAKNPAVVADLWRIAILGTAATLPLSSQSPSDQPPKPGTRQRRRPG